MKPRILLFDTGESAFFNALHTHSGVKSTTLVTSRTELMSHLSKHYKTVDLLITDLILDAEKISVQNTKAVIEFDGLSTLEVVRTQLPRVKVAVLSRYWHEKNVLAAYRAGCRWFEKRNHSAETIFVERSIAIANDQIVIPTDFDRELTNRIRMLLDSKLHKTSNTDQDMLFLMLEGNSNEEIAEHFNWSTVQSLYNRVSSILTQSGFTSREELLIHCRNINIDLPVH